MFEFPKSVHTLSPPVTHRGTQKKNRMGICLPLFGPQTQHLDDKQFTDDDDVQHEVIVVMRQQPKEICVAGIGTLIKRLHKCMNAAGDYAEE
ncbi:hypothetical protein TNCV_1242131 [Trichonephila clavipes]|nr:hypothetical protein TNCV_1242131 [Trichonephila clavipes]